MKEGINSPLSSSSRSIQRRKKDLSELESCVDQIDTITYHEFTIDQSYFKGNPNFTIGNEMIMTCYDFLGRKYK